MVLHGEGFLLMNGSMDLLCLLGTGRYLGLPLNRWRVGLAALLGSMYSLLCTVFPACGGLFGLLMASLLMGLTAFPHHALRGSAGLWMIGLCTSGVASAAGLFLRRDSAVLCACAMFAVSFCLMPPKKRGMQWGSLTVHWHGHTFRMAAVTDTGNMLRDPLSGLPVIVAPFHRCKGMMLENMHILPEGMRLIRAETAGGSTLLPCVHPDKVLLEFSDGVREVQAVLALSDAALPGALVPPSCWSEGGRECFRQVKA